MTIIIWNWNQYGYDQKDVIICALTGIICSIISIVTYFISKNFRNEMPSAKYIILIMSIYNLIHCIFLLDVNVDKPNLICAIQAIGLQVNEIYF